MAIELKAGQVVIMTSGTFLHRYVMGRIYGTPTPARIKVQQWDRRAGEWESAHSARDRNAVVAVVSPEVEPGEAYQQLQAAYDASNLARVEAEGAHKARVREIAQGITPESSTSEVERALMVFAACARDLNEASVPDGEWAKFRLLASDYRRAHALYVRLTGHEPPLIEDAHAALQESAR
jgi:hypothetical protein